MSLALVAVRSVFGFAQGAGRGLLLMAYFSAVLGALIGANNAATATTPGEAIVPADVVDDVQVTDEELERVDHPLVPDQVERHFDRDPHPIVRGFVERTARMMMGLAVAVANAVGPVLYVNAWIPNVVVKGALYLAMAPLFALPLLRLRRFFG